MAPPEPIGEPAAVVSGPDRYAVVRRVTLIGSVADLGLGVLKILGGLAYQSHALIADGIHSLSDLATDVMVLVAAKHAHVEADEAHPYGHGRIETVATVALGLALVAVALAVAFDGVRELLDPSTHWVPDPWAIWLALASVVVKEGIYHYTMHYARALRSKLLRANAWHSRSDAASSVVVIIGVGGTMLGVDYLDAVAAIVVAWMIAKIGYDLARQSIAELIDTALDPEQVEEIRRVIMSVDGVRDLHLLRTRQMAGRALVDVHIILSDPRLSVSEGHQISETVRGRLIRRIEDVEDVTVHIDPEDDEHVAPGRHLALRRELLERLQAMWQSVDGADRIKRVNLHYLNGRVHVEVELPIELAREEGDAAAIEARFARAIGADRDFGGLRVLFS
ncbi:MAG: cation transporter [Ectothiorhodospiraceae bacterium]|nr:cation transporter [Chromatiales bacterium]MCP5153280.1 cation transporter [Ectothiorhodospiraceae bacterium]